MEEALKEREVQYRNLFENANEAIFVAQDGWLVFLNPMSTMMIGYSGEELMAKSFTEFIHPDDREMVINRHSRRMKGEEIPFPYSFRIIHKDGNSKWVEVNPVLINWIGRPATLNFMSDITDRKQAEEVLRKRDILFKKLFSWVPGMIYQFMKRPDGTYCAPFTTEAIKNIFGCSPQDVREDFSPIARVILPEDFDKVINSIEDSAKHLTIWTCEYRVQIPGQSIRWILGNSTPEKLANGGIIWHGFNTDITERKRAEEELRTKTKDIEEANTALKVLLNQLEKGRNDLEERILSNIRELILPYVNNLRHGKLSVHQVSLVDTIESNLNRISSSFLQHLKLNFYDLTPREIEVANLVREGRSIKEIAELLSITIRTVESHRKRLRVKMGLKNRKANLRAHLLGLQ
jgi:PAS domain S-box-containing protein